MLSAGWPEVLLRRIVRALPQRQAAWGEAMQAELAAVSGRGARGRFVLGCLPILVRRPGAAAGLAGFLARAGLLAAAIGTAWAIDVPRMRAEALAVVVILLAGAGLLRRPVGFGRTSSAAAVRRVALGGAVIAATATILTFHRLQANPPLMLPAKATIGVYDTRRASTELIVLTLALGCYLTALARVTAQTSVLRPATVGRAASVAGLSTLTWLVVVVLHPGASASAGPALLAILAAGLLAGAATARTPHPESGPASRLGAGVLAAAAAAFGLGTLMDLLPLTGAWVSNSAPPSAAAHPPARIVDTVAVYLPGLILALVLAIGTLTGRRERRHPLLGARSR